MAPWRIGDAVVGRGNAGWTTSKEWTALPVRENYSQESPAETTGRGLLPNRPSCPPTMDNIKRVDSPTRVRELLTRVSCRNDWKRTSAESSLMSPDDPIGQGTELK